MFIVSIFSFLVLSLALVGCQPDDAGTSNFPIEQTPKIVVTTTKNDDVPDRVILSGEDFMLSLEKPVGWESFTTEYGIVMGEEFSSVAAGGELKGMMVYIFASPLEEYTVTTENISGSNTAHTIQMQIVNDPDYIGNARVNAPISFMWDAYEGAYYLLYDESINVMTMVMQIVIPESNVLLTNTVSAPHGQEADIRALLPNLFHSMKLNGEYLKPDALHQLPEFNFPEPTTNQSG